MSESFESHWNAPIQYKHKLWYSITYEKQRHSSKPYGREILAFCLEITHRGVGTIFHLPERKKVIKTSESPHRISKPTAMDENQCYWYADSYKWCTRACRYRSHRSVMGPSSAEGSEDGGKLREQHRTTDLSCLECSKRTVSRENICRRIIS
jgi:hypothetical protein